MASKKQITIVRWKDPPRGLWARIENLSFSEKLQLMLHDRFKAKEEVEMTSMVSASLKRRFSNALLLNPELLEAKTFFTKEEVEDTKRSKVSETRKSSSRPVSELDDMV